MANKTKPLIIGAKNKLALADIVQVAQGLRSVVLSKDTQRMLRQRRSEIVSAIKQSKNPTYGFNRGFGHNVDVAVAEDNLNELQLNLIRSHSAGVGPFTSRDIVRCAMLLRAQSLAKGHSGVRPEVVSKILEFLNKDICPAVPAFGSVGASGDLAPLSHVALALIGEGLALDKNSKAVSTKKILKQKNVNPLKLEMKEGLALNNGVQFSTAIGILAAVKTKELLQSAVIVSALSNQVLLGSDSAYDPELLALRPHKGAQTVGRWLRALIAGSPLRNVHKPYEVDGAVQDPYSLRCVPQILGAALDLIDEAEATFEVEANSVTDNPLILKQAGKYTRVVSGGHFHGMPIATKLYNLVQALSIITTLSNLRCARFVDENRNKGLGNDLIWPGLSEAARATSSGMMIPEYVSAALTNSVWGMAMPSHLFSLPTDAGQEDHVSMSATLAVRVLSILPRVSEAIAIEAAFAAQAAAIRKELETIPSKQLGHFQGGPEISTKGTKRGKLSSDRFSVDVKASLKYHLKPNERKLSPICEKILSSIYKIFPIVKSDRELSSKLNLLSGFVDQGGLNKIAQQARLFK